MRNIRYYSPGIMLILIAIVIIAVPEILVAFIASLILMAGISALYVGHKIRQSEIEIRSHDNWFSEDDFFGMRFTKVPIFRNRKW